MDTSVRKRIGKYEILGSVGRGGMGVVYRAEDTLIGRPVAIKTLNESLSGQPEMLKRFYREAQAPLHPNIAIVFDVGDEDGKPFIVMEFVDGDPLDKLLTSDRPLSMIEKLTVIEQVCTGLGYAHQCGVIHRDIKPANVMVKRNPIVAKIVDFGIASVQRAKFETGLTQTGTVIGSVHYISPERLKGHAFDGRSDIWATGVMLYQLLTGQLPFPGGHGEELAVMHKAINDPTPPLSTWLLSYPPGLDAIIDRALAKNPDERYATAEEFSADLHAVNEGLKKDQVGILFSDAERLASQKQFATARDLLRQLTGIDPQHTGARHLLSIVNTQLTKMQKAEELRKLLAEGEEALAAARFTDALSLFDQAVKRDPENTEARALLESAKEKRRRHEEIGGLMTRADFLRDRGDWTGALQVVEKALDLDPENTGVRAIHEDLAQKMKLAAQQGQVRELLLKARQEIASRHFTAAIEMLQEASQIDPAAPEMETLLQTAVSGQEQERRRKILEQIHAEIENCLNAENYDRATELAERAVEQLPSEPTLLQLKTRVAVQTRKAKVRKLIDATVARAQETFLQSPGEALLIVQKALQDLPGEERLVALEDSLRQRLKSAEKEEVRSRYLREAQAAIDRNQFEKAVEILESYQIEFTDASGVGELLEFARSELAKQDRRARIAACAAQVKPLLEGEQFDQAIRMLEAATAEVADPSLLRMLADAREQRQEFERRTEALRARVARLTERGQFDEAMKLLREQPTASVAGTPLNALLEEIRTKQGRQEAVANAFATATQSVEKNDFNAAIEAIHSVQRAWGDSPDLTAALQEIELRREQLASESVGKAVETARAALLANDAATALNELKAAANFVEFANPTQQTAWRRLKAEAAKPAGRKDTGKVAKAQSQKDLDFTPESPRRKLLVPLIAAGAAVVVLVGAILLFHGHNASAPQPAEPASQAASSAPAAAAPAVALPPSGTLLVQGNVGGADVFVDGALKGFTQADGTVKLLLDPGKHSIRLNKAGYTDVPPASVTIAENKEKSVRFDLKPSGSAGPPPDTNAYLAIHSNPGAAVSVDGAPQGNTDPRGDLVLPVKPGTHALAIALSGYQTQNQSLTFRAGDHQIATVMLNPIPVAPKPEPVAAAQPVRILSFSSSAAQIEQGHTTTLTWQTENASEVTIDNGIGQVDASGQTTVRPQNSTTYVLTAKGNAGTQTRTLNVLVEKAEQAPAPVVAPKQVDETALVQAVLNNFTAALRAHNLAGMRAAWTGMSARDAKLFQEEFKNLPDAVITDNCPASGLTVTGDTASWTCTEVTVLKGQEPRPVNIHFTFAKRNGAWTIADRR